MGDGERNAKCFVTGPTLKQWIVAVLIGIQLSSYSKALFQRSNID